MSTIHDGRRDGRRLPWLGVVEFGTGRLRNTGAVTNVSRTGMGLLSPVFSPPGSTFEFAIKESGKPTIEGRAEVRWTRLLAVRHRPNVKFEMGVRILDATRMWTDFFDRIETSGPTVKPSAPLSLRFVVPMGVATAMNGYITDGAAYVERSLGPKLGDLVLVPTKLPELTDNTYALGRVVEVRNPTDTDAGGVGLRYLRLMAGLDEVVRDDLRKLTDKLKLRVLDCVTAA